ncbi:MAG: UDP-N-acetylmuramate--alanine ligase [Burkholderiales bacterium]|nr:UDP-N-acetylmuramate--alanine ligase [Burkholderiales bacterium]
MSRERGRDDTRRAIAVHAARLMAQDGIEDYRLAKRKAAKLLGIPDARRLPNNDEIDAALREYRDIYQGEGHGLRIRRLRERALQAMRELADFEPHLTGSVLSGIAGPYAVIHLQLFTENPKAVELFLIDRGIAYRTSQVRLYAGQELRVLPVFSLEGEEAEIEITVLDARDLRAPIRATAEGRTIDRARLNAVEVLLQEP